MNSPAATPSVKKKARVRNIGGAARFIIPEETIVFDGQPAEEYSVTFDAGPIGLLLEPATCRVQRILGDDSPARAAGLIQEGDVVVAVNGVRVEPNDAALAVLRDTSARRNITFLRLGGECDTIVPVEGSENPSYSAFPGRVNRNVVERTPPSQTSYYASPPTSIEFIRTSKQFPRTISSVVDPQSNGDDVSKESGDGVSALLLPRALAMADPQNYSINDEEKSKVSSSAGDALKCSNAPKDAANTLQQLLDKVAALEAENAALRQPKLQNYAIKVMEYKMRVGALEEELKQAHLSKAKLKERARKSDQQLQEQSTNDGAVLSKVNEELSNVKSTFEETMQILDQTRSELALNKKEWENESSNLHRDMEKLTVLLDQHSNNLDRCVAAKLQSDASVRHLEDGKIVLEGELQRVRQQLHDSGSIAAGASEQLLESIREKDTQLDTLRLDLVSTQSLNATLKADLAAQDAIVRRAAADVDQLAAEKGAVVSELMSLSSIMEVTFEEKERLEGQLAKLEEKLSERNHTIDALKQSSKAEQDELSGQMAKKDGDLAAAADAIAVLCQESDRLHRELLELRTVAQSTSDEESRLRSSLERAHSELTEGRTASAAEKCNLLKRIEELEGDLIDCHDTIQLKASSIADAQSKIDVAVIEIDKLSSKQTQLEGTLTDAGHKIEHKDVQIKELKESAKATEHELRNKLAATMEDFLTSTRANDDLTLENLALVSQVDQLLKASTAASMEELKLRASLDKTKTELAELQLSAQAERDEFLHKIDTLQLQLGESQLQFEGAASELSSALSNVDALQIETDRLTSSLARAQFDLASANEKIVHGAEQQLSAKASAEAKEKELTNKLAFKTKQLADFSGTIAALKTEKSAFAKQLQGLRAAEEESASRLLKLRSEVVELTASFADSRHLAELEKKDQLQKLEASERKREESARLIEETKKYLSDALAAAAASTSLVDRLAPELSASKVNVIALTESVEKGNMMIESLKEAAAGRQNELERDLSEKTSQLDELRIQFETRAAELRESEQIAKETKQSLLEAMVNLETSELTAKRLESRLSEAEDNFATASNASERVNASLGLLRESTEAQRRELERERDEMVEQHAKADASVGILSSEKADLERELLKAHSSASLQRDKADQQRNALKADLAAAVEELAAANEAYFKISTDVKNMEIERKHMADSALDKDAEIAELSRHASALHQQYETEIASRDGVIVASTREMNDLTVQINELRIIERETKKIEVDLRADVDHLRLHLARSEADFQHIQDQAEEQKKELATVTIKLTTSETRHDKLLHEFRQSESSVATLTLLNDSSNAKVVSLKDSLHTKREQFERETARLKEELASSSEAVESLKSENDKVSDEFRELVSTVDIAKDYYSSLEAEIVKHKAELAASICSASAAESELQRQIELLKIDLLDRQSHLDNRDMKIVAISEELSSSLSANDLQSSELTNLRDSLQNARLRISALNSELDEANRREASLRTEADEILKAKMLAVSADASARLSEAQALLLSSTTKTQTLESQHVVATEEIGTLKTLIDSLLTEKSQLLTTLAVKEDAHLALASLWKDSTCVLESTTAELEEKLERLNTTKDSLSQAQMQVSALESRVKNLVHESSKGRDLMTSEIICLKQDNAAIATENSEMKAIFLSMEKKVADTDTILESLRENLRAEKESLNELTASAAATQWTLECKIESLSAEAGRYRELCSDLNEECKTLKTDVESSQANFDSLKGQHSAAISKFHSHEIASSRSRDELSAKIAADKKNVAVMTEKIRTSTLERDQVAKESATMQRRYEEQIRLLQYEADLKTKRQNEWTDERKLEMKGYRQCREELRTAKTTVARLEDSIKRAHGEVEHLTALSEQIAEENVGKMDSLIQCHATAIRRLQEEQDELEDAHRKTDEERRSASALLLEAKAEIVAARSERDKAVSEKNVLALALHAAKDKLSDLQCELENHQNVSLDSDSTGSPFKSQSKSDIKTRCLELQSALSDAEGRLDAANDNVSRRSEHVRQFASDLELMSNEIESLVAANGLLETRLKKVASLNETSEASATVAQRKMNLLENQSRNTTQKLGAAASQNAALTDQLQELRVQAKTQNHDSSSRTRILEEDNVKLEQALSIVTAEKKEAEERINDVRQKLTAERDCNLQSVERIQQLEILVSDLTANLALASGETLTAHTAMHEKIAQFEQLVSGLEADGIALRCTIAELQQEKESMKVSLHDKEENEKLLLTSLENQRQGTLVAEEMREDVVLKLTEASRVVTMQKETIKMLESRTAEAERTAASFSDRTSKLLATIKNVEASSDADGTVRFQEYHELERKFKCLEEKSSNLYKETNSLRDELREARREQSDTAKSNAALQNRADQHKASLNKIKAQHADSRIANEELRSSCRQLETELDNKQMEVEHLKAKVQVLTAASARMKADNLLQETSHGQTRQFSEDVVETRQFSEDVVENSIIQSELVAKTSKLQSLSEVYRSQQQVLSLSHTLEGQLIRFIEEIIDQTDVIFGKIAARSEKLHKYSDRFTFDNEIEALDLAGFEKQELNLAFFRASLDSLSLLIPHAVAQLNERREQLASWRKHRSDRVGSTPSTPNTKSGLAVPDSPAIYGAMQRMKAVLSDEILSPTKIQTASSDRLDVECMKEVIHSLEDQVDLLLTDLHDANKALHAKDLLFADLEKLASHHESARYALDQKVADLEERLTNAVSWKEAAEKEITQLREGLPSPFPDDHSAQIHHADPAACKLAAGRLIVHAIEGRANAAKAVAFRQWACQTSALRAVAKQGHAAAALARQLEETREKLVILKRHLKKTRRGPHDCGGLVSIAEHSSEV